MEYVNYLTYVPIKRMTIRNVYPGKVLGPYDHIRYMFIPAL